MLKKNHKEIFGRVGYIVNLTYQAVLGVRGLADAVHVRRRPAPDVATHRRRGRGGRAPCRHRHHARRGRHGGLLQRHSVALVHLQTVHHSILNLV